MSGWHDILTKPVHLVWRFFTSLPNTPPTDEDEAWVSSQLTSGEHELWVQMSNQDRRHSVAVARRFVGIRPQAPRVEIAGALLHDVGKIKCGLGTGGRVVATVIGPRTVKMRAYHDHEEIGAELLAAAGSDPATVELVAGFGPAYPDLEKCDR